MNFMSYSQRKVNIQANIAVYQCLKIAKFSVFLNENFHYHSLERYMKLCA